MTTTPVEPSTSLLRPPVLVGIRMPVALTLIALALGLSVEVLFYGHPPGISFFLWAASCVAAVVIAARVERVRITGSARLLLIPILFFARAGFSRQEPLPVFFSAP